MVRSKCCWSCSQYSVSLIWSSSHQNLHNSTTNNLIDAKTCYVFISYSTDYRAYTVLCSLESHAYMNILLTVVHKRRWPFYVRYCLYIGSRFSTLLFNVRFLMVALGSFFFYSAFPLIKYINICNMSQYKKKSNSIIFIYRQAVFWLGSKLHRMEDTKRHLKETIKLQ